MSNLIDTWKNSCTAFDMQLELNKKQLSDWPDHWKELEFAISIIKNDHEGHNNLLDVGCGCGAVYNVVKKSNISYYGVDYSDYAVKLAKKTWNYDHFYAMGYHKLNIRTNILYQSALVDVMFNGDEVFEKLLSYKYPYFISQRMELTEGEPYFHTYEAYDILTHKYFHNKEKLYDLIHKYNYDILQEKMLSNGLHLCLSLTR